MTHLNEDKNVSLCTERLTALAKFTTPNDVIVLNGVTFTQPQIVAAFQASLDARKTVTATRATAAAAVAQRRVVDAERRKMDKELRLWVVNKFGDQATQTTEFGYAPKPKAEPSAQVKADAVKKAAATKKARGVIGKNKRKAIKAPAAAEGSATPASPGAASPGK